MTVYGEHALRQYLGNQAFQYFLGDDWQDWPWHAWINVPLIPIYLFTARTNFFVSFTTWWGIFLAPQYTHLSADQPNNVDYLTAWPPHPMLIPILSPLLHVLYTPLRDYISRKVLGIDKPPERRTQRIVWDLERFQGRVEIDWVDQDGHHEAENDEDNPRDGARNGDNQAPNPEVQGQQEGVVDENNANAVANEATIRVTPRSMGMIIGSTLILPTVSNLMGALLYKLASKFKLYALQRFLGIRAYPRPRRFHLKDHPDRFLDLDPI